MAVFDIPAFDGDMEIIQALADEPNDEDGLSAAELKAKFDRAGELLKAYLNETLLPYLKSEDGAASLGVIPQPGFSHAASVQEALEALMRAISEATTGTLPDGSVTADKLAANAVTGTKIAPQSVRSGHIYPGSVGTTQLHDGAVTMRKLDLSGGFVPDGRIVLTLGKHYFNRMEDVPRGQTVGQVVFVKNT